MNQMETVIEELYSNQGSKLHQMCQSEMAKFGGIAQKDYDDFYSRVGYEITLATEKYNPLHNKTFIEYISGVIRFSVWKEMTARNRYKRQNVIEREEVDENGNLIKKKEYLQSISIDTPVDLEEGLTIADILVSDFTEEQMFAELGIEEDYSSEMKKYLGRLSNIQVKVLELMADGYASEEIKALLQIDSGLYADCVAAIRSYRNTKCIASLIRTI